MTSLIGQMLDKFEHNEKFEAELSRSTVGRTKSALIAIGERLGFGKWKGYITLDSENEIAQMEKGLFWVKWPKGGKAGKLMGVMKLKSPVTRKISIPSFKVSVGGVRYKGELFQTGFVVKGEDLNIHSMTLKNIVNTITEKSITKSVSVSNSDTTSEEFDVSLSEKSDKVKDPKEYLDDLKRALKLRLDRYPSTYKFGDIQFVEFFRSKQGFGKDKFEMVAKFKYDIILSQDHPVEGTVNGYVVFINSPDKFLVRYALEYSHFADPWEAAEAFERNSIENPPAYVNPNKTKSTSKVAKTIEKVSSKPQPVVIEASKNGANLKIGTKVVGNIGGEKVTGTVTDEWAINEDDGKFALDFTRDDGDGQYMYLYQIISLDGKPLSAYPELAKWKNR